LYAFLYKRNPRLHRLIRASWLAICLGAPLVRAQDTQFLPEIDAHVKVNPWLRAYLQAKDDRDGGDPEQFTFGPSVQIYFKQLLKLQRMTLFDLDDAKTRPLVFESGYRIITAPNTPNENRALEAVTVHLPLWAGLLASDRNRADLDWKNGVFTWRYRNKLAIERVILIRCYLTSPPNPSMRVNTTSGAPPISTLVRCFLWVSTSNSISITNTRTTLPKSLIARTTTWGCASTCFSR